MRRGQYGWNTKVDYFKSNTIFITEPAPPTSNYGVLNIGSGPFDGLSTGFFVGNTQHFSGQSSNTQIAVNAPSGFTGSLLDLQIAGSSVFKITPSFSAIQAFGVHSVSTSFSGDIGLGLTNVNVGCAGSDGGGNRSAFGAAGAIGGIVYLGGTGAGRATVQIFATALITPIVIQSAIGQTTNLQEWQDSSSVIQAMIAPPVNSANYGILSIGTSAWDGTTVGKFVGSSNGTQVAVNAASGYTGNLLDLQVAGTSKFGITSAGSITIPGATDGQLLIGQTSDNTLALATLTAGTNVTITNSGHSISIASTAGGSTAAASDYVAALYMFT